jgi:bifunctional non-homologous end joining protein LigD
VREQDLRTRKRLLRDTIEWRDPLRFTTHRNREGEAMFADACHRGWEGVVAKRVDSAYRDTRSKDWLKFKCEAGQELVVGGFTAPRGSRVEFGAARRLPRCRGCRRPAALRGQGRDRLRHRAAAFPRGAAARPGDRRAAVR